jgi:hypothetical protein
LKRQGDEVLFPNSFWGDTTSGALEVRRIMPYAQRSVMKSTEGGWISIPFKRQWKSYRSTLSTGQKKKIRYSGFPFEGERRSKR